MKLNLTIALMILGAASADARNFSGAPQDTVVERTDVMEESVVSARGRDGISKLKGIKTEVISSAGLCKMACCALASSFENSGSITVGYADAVTGARQIKLLGLSGIYTQLLEENRPTMRALAAPFGMSFIPGQWLESIQISKGPSSVSNGLEAITGQINLEQRKPTDETPLYVQVYGGSDAMVEANLASALQINDNWSTVTMAHFGSTFKSMDSNGDGFRDDPWNRQLSIANRWLYYDPDGIQVRFGLRYIDDDRIGGQMGSTDDMQKNLASGIWGSNIRNRQFNAYAKLGIPLDPQQNSSIAMIVDYTRHNFDSFFGNSVFDGSQNSIFANLLYSNAFNARHAVKFGLTYSRDGIDQLYRSDTFLWRDSYVSLFGEYTLTLDDKFTFTGGAGADYDFTHGFRLAPRGSVRYSFSDAVVLRLLGGMGRRNACIFTDNIGMLSSGRSVKIDDPLDRMEEAWTWGGNAVFYLPFGDDPSNTYLSFDYFHSNFISEVIADQEKEAGFTCLYNLDGLSYTDTYQVDFNVDPFTRFNVNATFRYNDAKVTLAGQGLVERPLTSRFKAVLNLQYATRMNKWTFDFTAQLNGPVRLPRFAAEAWGMEVSPVYPTLFAQITRKFKGIDIYAGAENITGFRQKDAIISPQNPFSPDFNAGCVWGPLMGAKFYAGLRYTLWKM